MRWWWRDGGDAVRVAAALGGAVVRGGAVRVRRRGEVLV